MLVQELKKGGASMTKKFKVRFSQGVFVPLEKIDVPKGKELIITIPDEPKERNSLDAFRAAAGSWKNTE